MMANRKSRDNRTPLRVVVHWDRLLEAKPPGIVVVKGWGRDNTSFFSSAKAAQAWQKAHGGEGKLFTLEEAVRRGAILRLPAAQIDAFRRRPPRT